MASSRPRQRVGVRILMGLVRVLAAAVIAIAGSAALADLSIDPVDFTRILPVILTGEGILYILMLGGGAVRAPVMLLALVLAFALRAGISVSAGELSPQVSGDLIGSAKFYYAAYWPAAVAQVLLVALTLRLIRPLIATRKRRLRPSTEPEVSEALQEDRHDEERREVLLGALAEDPDEPPVSPTVLEERQIGDLTAAIERELSEAEVVQALELPFDEEAPEDAEEAAELPAEPEEADAPLEDEPPLPPGVIDATPGAVREPADAPEPADETAVTEEAAHVEEEPAAAELEPVAEEAETVAAAGPGEDTARFAPVAAQAPSEAEELLPASNLQGMVDAIAQAAGDGTDVRVWRTPDDRTVLAAVPAGTPAAGTGGHANTLVSAHLEICAWLGEDATCTQIAAGPIGAWALRAVDPAGGVMLLMASRGEAAAGRLQLAAERAAEAVRGMAEAAGAPEAPVPTASALPISPEKDVAKAVSEAARSLDGRFTDGWQAWRGPHRRIIAVHAAPGTDLEELARKTARLVAPIERFADAVGLESPEWVAIAAGQTLLAMHWAARGGEPAVLATLTTGGVALGRVRWELGEIARLIAE